MQLAIQPYAVDDGTAVGLERAAIVMQVHAGGARDDAVGDARGQLARKLCVLPVLAPATDHVHTGVGFQTRQQQRNIVRLVLQVGIQRHHIAPAHAIKARLQCAGLTVVARQEHRAQPGARGGKLAQLIGAAIARTVVHRQQFKAQRLR